MEALVKLYQIPPEMSGERLDVALARLIPELSRNRIRERITRGDILLDDRPQKPKYMVKGGEQVRIAPPASLMPSDQAQALPLHVLHEDDHLLVINKAAGMVVHPGAGTPDGTLLNALLHHRPSLQQLPRAGIVHRLDKDTSGLLVVAATETAHKSLSAQLAQRRVTREYLALVRGRVIAGGTIIRPLGRHPGDRKKMAVVHGGRDAITHYRVAERLAHHTLLRVRLETGRTHQIRVHMAHLNHPIVGDPLYGNRKTLVAGAGEPARQALRNFQRQALHAVRLELLHPGTDQPACWECSLPADFSHLLAILRDAG